MNPTAVKQDRLELELRGLHCAGCVGAVEGALRRVPGVTEARVNLATSRAAVWLAAGDRSRSTSQLIDAVRAAGYDAQAAPPPGAGPPDVTDRLRQLRRQRWRLGLAALLALPVLAGHVWPAASATWLIQGVLTSVVLLLAAGPMLAGAGRAVLARRANMDLLVSLGALVAFGSSLAGAAAHRHVLVQFDAAVMIVLFVSLGKYLESRARGRASAALEALLARVPRNAVRLDPDGPHEVPIEVVQPGDRLRVAAHMTVAVDGEVVLGTAALDEALLTGEALPVQRGVGDTVLGGTLVTDGLIEMRATATGAASAAARIATLVAEAQASKPQWQRLADRVAGVFVPAVIVLALLTLGGWKWLAGADAFWAVERMIAVLVVACPCALGLAIPTAVLVGTTRAAEHGILVRDAAALEAAGQVRVVLLDKTGTLTIGRPALERLEVVGAYDETAVLRAAAGVEQLAAHPLARALMEAARQRGLTVPEVQELDSRPGDGVRGVVEGQRVVAGSAAWLSENNIDTAAYADRAEAVSAAGMSVVWVAVAGRVAGLLGFADALHPESAAAVRSLADLGVETRILSGDGVAAVQSAARALGIAAYEARLRPADKLRRLRELMGDGLVVAMVGDGINDAPALAAADVGIAIGTGADVAREAADICLVGHSPRLIAEAVRISRASRRIMKQNLLWAVAYNVIMLPAAMITPLPPALAAAAMMGSSLTVVGNALRLRRVI